MKYAKVNMILLLPVVIQIHTNTTLEHRMFIYLLPYNMF